MGLIPMDPTHRSSCFLSFSTAPIESTSLKSLLDLVRLLPSTPLKVFGGKRLETLGDWILLLSNSYILADVIILHVRSFDLPSSLDHFWLAG